ncbi:hypothetical protein MTR_2g450680 [Medicago truncatula]|uniref:Uncharacterized protein n=1 Tax=Medicago truncatula TaxID=3880 RepID=A0A072VIE4_MEDTR|nr:hypothetical protein MTR_2g450680 [Medicago truncatula]
MRFHVKALCRLPHMNPSRSNPSRHPHRETRTTKHSKIHVVKPGYSYRPLWLCHTPIFDLRKLSCEDVVEEIEERKQEPTPPACD